MKQKLVDSIKRRLRDEVSPRNPVKFLKTLDIEEYIGNIVSTVYLYTRVKKGLKKNTIFMSGLIAAIGHNIRNKYKLKRDSALAAKAGAFILYSFEELGMLEVVLGTGPKGHNAYIIHVINDEQISALWETIPVTLVEKLPSETPYEPWVSSRHPTTGTYLVKTNNTEVLAALTPETHPMLFNCVNKAQTVGWRINRDVYDLQLWALRNKTDVFSNIWDQLNPEARQTKLRETKAIASIAKRFLDKTFYHLYYYDFRARKYCATAFLHEQGSDVARGLLLRDDAKPVGEAGFHWLLISIASTWAGDAGREDGVKTDKIPLKDRITWSIDNEEILLSYADSPKVNQGWMHADKPWQFLAACIELKNLRLWQLNNTGGNTVVDGVTYHEEPDFENYGYISHFESFIDGSNNGSQHLAALTRDEVTAPHVNLVPLDLPGDLYKYVADHVWEHLEEVASTLNSEERIKCERFIDNLIELKKQINQAEPKSDHRADLVYEIKEFKESNEDLMDKASSLFWLRIRDTKQKRKIVKRNTMTIPYGGTAFGLGQQIIDDSRKHGIDQLLFMEHKWGAFLGREVFTDCKKSLEKPMQLLTIFEQAGKAAEDRGEFLSWTVPITNFPVVQHYTEGQPKKLWIQYGPQKGPQLNTGYYVNTYQLSICFLEDMKPSKGKQSQGAAPNVIHSLDAAHLALTVWRCDFPVTTVHDSFGCLLADMPELYKTIRETFVELYAADPLTSIMKDIGGDFSEIQIGTLDLSLVLDSEYCFA